MFVSLDIITDDDGKGLLEISQIRILSLSKIE